MQSDWLGETDEISELNTVKGLKYFLCSKRPLKFSKIVIFDPIVHRVIYSRSRIYLPN